MKWIIINYYTMQFLVGPENFKAKLNEMGLVEEGRCSCG